MATWDGFKRMFRRKRDLPEGLWMKCEDCGSLIYRKEVEQNHRVCPECAFHFTLPARDRIRLLVAFHNTPGAEGFFRSHASVEDRPLKPGFLVADTIRLEPGWAR